MEYRSSCFGEGAGHAVPLVGKCRGRGCCFGVQTRARSDFMGRKSRCIGSRWLKWKVVFRFGEGRLRLAPKSSLLAEKVVFVRLQKSSLLGREGRLRLTCKVVFDLKGRLRLTLEVVLI